MPNFYPPSAEIEIAAPITRVWEALLDGARYPEWNDFIMHVDGDLQETGVRIPMQVKLGDRTVRPCMKVTVVEAPGTCDKAARWVHQYDSWLARRGWLTSERQHEMTPIAHGSATLYKTWEPFAGWMKAFVPFRKIDEGFKAQARQLKQRAEALT